MSSHRGASGERGAGRGFEWDPGTGTGVQTEGGGQVEKSL